MYIFIVYFILKDISLHHVRYKSKNNEKENMKEEKIPCRIIRYREFPDLLFGTLREDGTGLFRRDTLHPGQRRCTPA